MLSKEQHKLSLQLFSLKEISNEWQPGKLQVWEKSLVELLLFFNSRFKLVEAH